MDVGNFLIDSKHKWTQAVSLLDTNSKHKWTQDVSLIDTNSKHKWTQDVSLLTPILNINGHGMFP